MLIKHARHRISAREKRRVERLARKALPGITLAVLLLMTLALLIMFFGPHGHRHEIH